ncbi:MAG TPA: hypothetical protein PLI18_02570 [Pirellulaceae bacterium]|nr:hypothetical protein [Pirellulaceae bacterium]
MRSVGKDSMRQRGSGRTRPTLWQMVAVDLAVVGGLLWHVLR